MRKFIQHTLLAGLLTTAACCSQAQVGLQRQNFVIAHGDGGTEEAIGLIWYPTSTPSTLLRLGPFEVNATRGAPPAEGRHPLLLISHGTGGNELGHAWLAQALAAEGYIVVTPRHPGDNFEDRSRVSRPAFLVERPQQLSGVLDKLLADPKWAALIDPTRIAAVGHSAGGHSVLALAGGQVDTALFLNHCSASGAGLKGDPALCALAGFNTERPAPMRTAGAPRDAKDTRIRAVVAEAPMGQALDAASLGRLRLPVLIEVPLADKVLLPAFNGERLCQAMPSARCERSPSAGHFAAFQAGTGRLGSDAGDPSEDTLGFDRLAWQAGALARIRSFLAEALR